MEGTKIATIVVIAVLGLLATILGIFAESSRKTGIVNTCNDVKNPLTSLGISAALVLLVSQIVANACGGCVCCCTYDKSSPQGQKRVFAIACLALSWVACVVGFVLLLDGSILNGQESSVTMYDYYDNYYTSCIVVKQGIMGGGGAMVIVSTGFAIAYFLLATQVGSKSTNVVIGQPVVQMGPVQDAPIDFNQRSQLGPHA